MSIKERENGVLSSLKKKQKKLIDRLSPPRLQSKNKFENTKSMIDVNKLVSIYSY